MNPPASTFFAVMFMFPDLLSSLTILPSNLADLLTNSANKIESNHNFMIKKVRKLHLHLI